jgi:four helix bundle protein
MAKIQSFRDLEVWRLAMDAVIKCYAVTEHFPADERFALRRDTRRTATSVPANIAEGHNRHANNVYLNHVNIALGSTAELETQIEIAIRLGYTTRAETRELDNEPCRVGQMLRRLQQSLEASKRRSAVLASAFLIPTRTPRTSPERRVFSAARRVPNDRFSAPSAEIRTPMRAALNAERRVPSAGSPRRRAGHATHAKPAPTATL